MKNSYRVLMALLFTGVFASMLTAASRYSVASGSWNSTAVWSATSGGTAGASCPVAGDVAVIERGFTVTLTANAACAGLYIGNGYSTGTGNGTLTFQPGVTLAASGTVYVGTLSETMYGTLTLADAATLQCGGNFSVATTYGTFTSSTGTVEYNSAGNQTVAALTYHNLTLSNSGGKQLSTITVTGDFVNNGTTTSGSGNVTLSGTNAQTIGSFTTTGELIMYKSGGTATLTGNVSATGMTINYTGGALHLGSNLSHSLSGSCFIQAGTLDCGSSTLNLSAASAAIDYKSGTLTVNAGTVNYSGGAQTIVPMTYNNLTLSGTAGKIFPAGTTTVNGTLSIENGAYANSFTGSLAYGSAAGIKYNTTVARTTSSEWPQTFYGSGGITIGGTGTITTSAKKIMNYAVLSIQSGASLIVAAELINPNLDIYGSIAFSSSGSVGTGGYVQIRSGGTWNGTGGTGFTVGDFYVIGNFTAGDATYYFGTGTYHDISGPNGGFVIPHVVIEDSRNLYGVMNASESLAGDGSLVLTGGSTLKIGGTSTLATLDAHSHTCTVVYNGGNQDVNCTFHHLTLEGAGVKTFGSATTSIGGNLTFNSAASAALNNNISIGGNLTLNNISSAALNQNISIGGDMTLNGSTSVALNNNISIGGNLIVQSGATLTLGTYTADRNSSGGTLAVLGTLEVSGASNFPANYSAFTLEGTVIYNGAVPQTIAPKSYRNLTINNTSASGVAVGGPTSACGVLALTDGIVAASATNTLTSIEGVISGASAASYINGPLAIQRALVGSPSFLYPIGKGGVYRPVTLSYTQSTTDALTITAEMFNGAPTVNTLPGTLNKVSAVRYYNITKGSGGSAFTAGKVNLNYGSDDLVSDNAYLRVAQGPAAGGGTWTNLGGAGSAIPAGSITSVTAITDVTLSSNSLFALANATGGGNALPVELTSFTAEVGRNKVELKWQTATEVNNAGFELERSEAAGVKSEGNIVNGEWRKIAFIEGHGTTNAPQSYSVTDKPGAGKFQYRLKQIDRDGKYEYSESITIEIEKPAAFALKQNYPNPFNPATTISYQLPVGGFVSIKIFDASGRLIATLVNENKEAGSYDVTFDAGNLSSGVYFCRMNAAAYPSLTKMILTK